MKKYSKGKRQMNKEAKRQAAAQVSTENQGMLKIKKRVSGRDSIVSQATAPSNINPSGGASPMASVPAQ